MPDANVCSDALMSIVRQEYPRLEEKAIRLCSAFRRLEAQTDGSHKNNQEEDAE
jgi:hypothetical protein